MCDIGGVCVCVCPTQTNTVFPPETYADELITANFWLRFPQCDCCIIRNNGYEKRETGTIRAHRYVESEFIL